MGDPGPNAIALQILKRIPARFDDAGCSNAPDAFAGRDLRPYCRIHDWRYCGRCHRAGGMYQYARRFADKELGWNIRDALPWGFRWIGWGYWRATHRFGGMSAWNSCGPTRGELCRHNMPMPPWMVWMAESDCPGGE